ncbi:PHP domain-containing protein [Aeromonas hydrophila]|uniref:RNase RNM n=1 Tax=Aeromonas hydrophila TaxID=644 RepID=UPI001A334444|nr:PHP domain-containing protein [Aeromonas hydrophila]EHA1066645.1 PHP domain-containing protein [Aeromonas hydrophila]MDD9228620.1 PHP domain-containing protein [Aeromonas hydrophila]HAT1553251.1 PHP domain-containing protein [Aeromonas hydrophila]
MRFDLHCHTTASDGVLSPAELVRRAAEKQVEVLAVTDHDTLAGLDEVRRTIENEQLPLRLVSGVEISTGWEHHEIHIVALGVDEKNVALTDFLVGQQARREARAQEIGRRLEKCQIPGTYEEAKQLAGDAAVTRAHFARVLVARGVADNMQKVFKKYLSRGNKGYVPAEWPEMGAAIDAIHGAGGLAVLAHPSRYDLTAKWIKRLLVAFKAAGGDAMEVSLPQQSPQERANLGQWAKEHDLYISVGSDFHFPSNWTELGRHLWLPKEGTPLWLAHPGHFSLSAEQHAALLASR